MEFEKGQRVYYPHPIVDKQTNKTTHHEERIGKITEIRSDKEECSISSDGNQIYRVKVKDLRPWKEEKDE